MKAFVTSFLLIFANVHAQTSEKLYCGQCGERNQLSAVYCSACGERIDKKALIARLEARVTSADSLSQQIVLTKEELGVLIEAKTDRKIQQLKLRGEETRRPPPTETEQLLNTLAPILALTLGVLMIRHWLF
jgi:predicted amidophosphoribosyltransferase